ncbi:MAG: restriction endonuclease subunit S [Ottowia sp.]|nr:restriction endonuclease subunit S [Ottowia sp.]MBK6616469.1 restriction endonuclease subunit S [Ottowia sp.]
MRETGQQQEWPVVRLADIATKIRSGATPRGGAETYLAKRKRHALLRSQNVLDHRFTEAGLAFISDSQADELKGAAVQEGDILLNITGDGATFGRACLVPKKVLPACVNQHVVLIRTDKTRCRSEYLLAWLTQPSTKAYIESFNAGGSRRAITKGHIESFQLPLPPIAVQKEISDLASSINNRIELLTETNATLERIAMTLFKAWFIDFNPVLAKAEGLLPEGIDAATAAIFPAAFTESPMGKIPDGWSTRRLDECCDLNPRRDLRKGTLAPYLEMANAPTEGHRPEKLGTRELSSGTKFVNGDTLLAKITPCLENGKTAFVDFLPDAVTAWGSTEFIVMCPRPPLPPYWAYLLARLPAFRAFAIQSMTGTSGRQRVDVGRLGQFMVAVPDQQVAKVFAQIVGPMQRKIAANAETMDSLAAIRDAIFPRLISGALSLPEHAEAIEGAIA